MKLSENSIYTLNQRYLRKDINGKIIETPEEMMCRVARICKDPELERKILVHLLNLDFLPNSPTLMNAGTDLGQLSACFVLPVGDSLIEIFDAIKYTAIIHQSGGGTGYNFSHIRPEGSPVKSTQGIASGAVSFMENFNVATGTIKQGGKRRGAMMGILNIDHPEIEKFISCKDKGNKLENFNISVAATDSFMNAVIENKDWNLAWKGKIIKTVKAKYLFDLIVDNAYSHGDPGLIFIDEINRKVKSGEEMESTNPCGEQPLLPYESCNLASINLNNMLTEHEGKYYFHFDKISNLIKNMVLFMNDIIDANHYPLPQIRDATLKTRKIGIGIMGWADALIKIGVVYGSIESLQLAENLMKYINEECHKVSISNGNLTTIAPTGTISVIAGTSSGIEPIYAVAYKRNLKESMGMEYYEVDPEFVRIAKEKGFYSEELISKISKNHGSVKGIDIVPKDIQQLFVTAHDIPYDEHIMVQAAFQKYTDSACSKTINMNNGIKREDIYNAYMLAWKLKCKGITVYRDGSKNQQVLTTSDKVTEIQTPRPRNKDQIAIVREIPTGCGTLYNIISFDQIGILEDFVVNSGNGGCESSQSTEGRFLSSMFRYNIPTEVIIKQARRSKPCSSCLQKSNGGIKIDIKSCADGIGKHIQDYHSNEEIRKDLNSIQKKLDATINKGAKIEDNLTVDAHSINKQYKCPNCGSTNVDPGKCKTCHECGISMCL